MINGFQPTEKMKTANYRKLLAGVCLLIGVVSAWANAGNDRAIIRAADREFSVEIATTIEEKRLGLMYRRALPESHGLLMVFENDSSVPIWMKNVFVPLDVVWLSVRGQVIDRQTLPPCHQSPCPIYRPTRPARYVLEVGGGLFPLKVGDKVEIIDTSGDSLLPFAPAS
jgi:uncharacterized membrane protein (UPF0127 family)